MGAPGREWRRLSFFWVWGSQHLSAIPEEAFFFGKNPWIDLLERTGIRFCDQNWIPIDIDWF